MAADKTTITILSLNDFPVGGYSTLELAISAAKDHQSEYGRGQRADLNYHMKDIVLDAPAKL